MEVQWVTNDNNREAMWKRRPRASGREEAERPGRLDVEVVVVVTDLWNGPCAPRVHGWRTSGVTLARAHTPLGNCTRLPSSFIFLSCSLAVLNSSRIRRFYGTFRQRFLESDEHLDEAFYFTFTLFNLISFLFLFYKLSFHRSLEFIFQQYFFLFLQDLKMGVRL